MHHCSGSERVTLLSSTHNTHLTQNTADPIQLQSYVLVQVVLQAPAQQLKLQADVESVLEAAVPPHDGTSLRA